MSLFELVGPSEYTYTAEHGGHPSICKQQLGYVTAGSKKAERGLVLGYLESRLAYRIQELAYGGLKPATIERLEAMGENLDGGDVKQRRIRADLHPTPGTRLIPWMLIVRSNDPIGQAQPYRASIAIMLEVAGHSCRRVGQGPLAV